MAAYAFDARRVSRGKVLDHIFKYPWLYPLSLGLGDVYIGAALQVPFFLVSTGDLQGSHARVVRHVILAFL